MEVKQHTMNNQQITEEMKKEIKICIETNENENTTIQIPAVHAVAKSQTQL